MKDVQKRLGKMRRDLGDKAAVMALNKTAAKGKTEMARAISSEYAIRQAEVRPKLRVLRASRGRLTAILDPWGSGKRRSLNVVKFMESKVSLAEGRRRKKGGTQNQLRFKIKKGGAAKTITGAFIGNKGRTVFKRTGDARLPIEAVQTVGVPQMFSTRRINIRVLKRIRKEFPIEFERAARQVIRRHSR